MLAVTAYVLRWIHNVQGNQPKRCGPLSSEELTNARRYLVKVVQFSTYQEEVAYLLKKRSKCLTLVRQLSLYLDDKQLIQCGEESTMLLPQNQPSSPTFYHLTPGLLI